MGLLTACTFSYTLGYPVTDAAQQQIVSHSLYCGISIGYCFPFIQLICPFFLCL